MASWGSYHFYPPVVGLVGVGLEYDTSVARTRGREQTNANLSSGLRRIQIGGGKLHLQGLRDWEAFQRAVKGQHGRFLFRLKSSLFEMNAEPIGTGDGAQTEFQLKKVYNYPYGPGSSDEETVRFPWHNYPPLLFANGKTWLDTEMIRVFVNGVEKTLTTHYTVEREGGLITFVTPPANGAVVTATCKYFILARQNQDFNPIQATSEGLTSFTIPSGVEIYEPRGGLE